VSSIYERERNAAANVAARIGVALSGVAVKVDACVVDVRGPDWSATLIVSYRPTDAGSRTVRYRGRTGRKTMGPFLGPAGSHAWRAEMVAALVGLVGYAATTPLRLEEM
jgi:hypothetical protein